MGTTNLEAADTKLPIIDGTNPPCVLRDFLLGFLRRLNFLCFLVFLVLRLPPVILIDGRTVELDIPNKSRPALTVAVVIELGLKKDNGHAVAPPLDLFLHNILSI